MPAWMAVASVDAIDAAGALLSPVEQARCARLVRPADREAFTAARALTRALLRATLGHAEQPFVQVCPSCGGPHGRPDLGPEAPHVSWAHAVLPGANPAPGIVTAAVADAPVGVDVELVRDSPLPGWPPGKRGWLRWTRTEALVKRGDGDLDAILAWTPARLAAAPGLTDVVGPGWVASIAADGPATVVDL